MINVGILGAASHKAGELVRILINHPDVEIKMAYAPSKSGYRLTSVHHGLIGETTLTFSEKINFEDIDVVFLCFEKSSEFNQTIPENICVIDIESDKLRANLHENYVYGLPELNRKPLVRGAKKAYTTSPVASLVLTSLLPLAQHLLLNSDLDIHIYGNEELLDGKDVSVNCAPEISNQLKIIQRSFSHKINYTIHHNSDQRGLRMRLALPCSVAVDDVIEMYESAFDDHNFTFIVAEAVSIEEVEGTNKCIISLDKNENGTLQIDSVVDARMRGGAGEAVHIMNLMFGLHEKTGLSLKATAY